MESITTFQGAVSGRVRVERRSGIGTDVRVRMAAAAQTLRHTVLPRLDSELGVTFPLVSIAPVCWFHQMADGDGGLVSGRVGPLACGDRFVFGVLVCATPLLEYPEPLIEGVLVHEFLHYVWWTRRVEAAQRGGEATIDLSNDGLYRDYAYYRQHDGDRAADPSTWLSARLRFLLGQVEDENSPELKAARERVAVKWVKPGLLDVEPVSLQFAVNGTFVLDEQILSKSEPR